MQNYEILFLEKIRQSNRNFFFFFLLTYRLLLLDRKVLKEFSYYFHPYALFFQKYNFYWYILLFGKKMAQKIANSVFSLPKCRATLNRRIFIFKKKVPPNFFQFSVIPTWLLQGEKNFEKSNFHLVTKGKTNDIITPIFTFALHSSLV